MADTGWLEFTSFANVDNSGGPAWSPVANAQTSNDTYAEATLSTAQTSDYLVGKAATVSLPTGATVDGIEAEVEASYGGFGLGTLYVTKNGTAATNGGSSIGDIAGSDTIYTAGGASSLWGTTWSESEVEASTFGVMFVASDADLGGSCSVDRLRVKVYYTETGGGSDSSMVLTPTRMW